MSIDSQRCPVHNFLYVSMPREKGEHQDPDDDELYIAKCPLLSCRHGVIASQQTLGEPKMQLMIDDSLISHYGKADEKA
jgi:hypothetical protein